MTGLSETSAFRHPPYREAVRACERAVIVAQAASNSVPTGEYAPAFVLPRWDHGHFGFSDLLGRPALLHFYAGGESAWREQTQSLNRLAALLERLGIGLIGVIAADAASIARHCKTAGMSYPILVDWEPTALVARIYGFHRGSGRPDVAASYLIDSRGVVRWKAFVMQGEKIDIPTFTEAVELEPLRPFAADC
jgi:peroxiredoxin